MSLQKAANDFVDNSIVCDSIVVWDVAATFSSLFASVDASGSVCSVA
jgi:hypothetical protein